jgi:predicted aspartyl protease
METPATGRVLTRATVESMEDLAAAERGFIPADQVRRVEIPDVLVDTGTTMFSLPTRMIRQLGLRKADTRRVTSSTGPVQVVLYSAVRLTIKGRFCTMDVMESPDNAPAMIGRLPLLSLDFVVDPQSCSLIGNPAHGGEQMYELY